MDESKFVRKYCNKKFSCGKALEGHIRSHVVAESDEKFDMRMNFFSKDSLDGYGLRENRKKTWRSDVDSKAPLCEGQICKVCGKGFKSLKALCGHMACHSDKDKSLKDDCSWTSEMVMDSFSDTETDRMKLRNSKSFKSKKSIENSPFSSVSEIDGHEQEEVAISLILLSKDQISKGNVHSVVESSDNNSVVLETKSSSNGTEKLDCMIEDIPLDVEMENSDDSGYFLCESTEIESYEAQVHNKSSKIYSNEDGTRKGKIVKTDEAEGFSKRSKYECYNCNKIFKSYQALGGHRPCNRRSNVESRFDDDKNCYSNKIVHQSGKSNSSSQKPKKNHVCPFCDRVFKNGQALGGHKRSHFINCHDATRKRTTTPLMKLDLNLPAPETGNYSQLFSS